MAALACLAPSCVFNRRVSRPVDAARAERIRELFADRKVIVTLRLGDPKPVVVKGLAQFSDHDAQGFEVVQSERTRRVSFEQIKELRTSRRGEAIAWGTLVGSMAGLMVGGLWGYVVETHTCRHSPGACISPSRQAAVGAALGGGAGAAAGFIVGSIVGRGPIWRFD